MSDFSDKLKIALNDGAPVLANKCGIERTVLYTPKSQRALKKSNRTVFRLKPLPKGALSCP